LRDADGSAGRSGAIDADEVLLPIDRAVPCGLIVNELVTNSFKHAFPNGREGTITVTLRRLPADPGHQDWVLLAVADDGVGIPPDLDPAVTGSLGLQLVHGLADQLRATLTIDRQDPTRFALTLPLGTR
jgi:two-component system, sensor histidine kinase PdtaS